MTAETRLPRLLLPVAVLLVAQPAHAYLDAGSASMVFQALIGAAVGGLVFVKIYWHKIKAVFGFAEADPKADEEQSAE